jgi:hypothetical protein
MRPDGQFITQSALRFFPANLAPAFNICLQLPTGLYVNKSYQEEDIDLY